MTFYNNDLDDDSIDDIIKEKEEEQEQYIQEQYDKGVIPDYRNIQNSNSKKKNGNPITITSEIDIEKNKILNEIQKLRQENPDLTFEQWSNTLKEKRQKLNDKVNEYFPEISLELDFI